MFKNLLQKIWGPILGQLKQGVTPHKLSQTIAFGTVMGIFPVLGTTTTLCLLVTFIFKLNHVVIQTMNYVIYPLQLLLLVPFYQLGAWLFHKPSIPMSVSVIIDEFKSDFGMAMVKWFWVGMRGVAVWLIVAPIIYIVVYYVTHYLVVKVSSSRLQK